MSWCSAAEPELCPGVVLQSLSCESFSWAEEGGFAISRGPQARMGLLAAHNEENSGESQIRQEQ